MRLYSVREAQKAAQKKQQDTISAHVRGDDGFLPDDILNSLPTSTAAMPAVGEADAVDMYSRAVQKAKAKARAKAEAAAAKVAPRDGLPKVITRSGTVEVAVLPSEGAGKVTKLGDGSGGGGGGI